MKRSAAITIGMVSLLLASCGDNPSDGSDETHRQYESLQDCITDSDSGEGLTVEDCRANFADAEADHEKTAPQFADERSCSSFSGGECTAHLDGSRAYWIPAMVGFAVGVGLTHAAMPLYRGRNPDCRDKPDSSSCRASGTYLYSHGGYVGYSSTSSRTVIYTSRTSPLNSRFTGRSFVPSVTVTRPVTPSYSFGSSVSRPVTSAPRASFTSARGGFGGHAGSGGS